MNFDTGVINASSLSIGACPRAGTAVPPPASSAATAKITNRFIGPLLSEGQPAPGLVHRPPPPIVPRRPRPLVHSRLEPPLEAPTPADLVQRSPDPGAQPRQVGGAERRGLDQ